MSTPFFVCPFPPQLVFRDISPPQKMCQNNLKIHLLISASVRYA